MLEKTESGLYFFSLLLNLELYRNNSSFLQQARIVKYSPLSLLYLCFVREKKCITDTNVKREQKSPHVVLLTKGIGALGYLSNNKTTKSW
jgi:hypothetical protein